MPEVAVEVERSEVEVDAAVPDFTEGAVEADVLFRRCLTQFR